MGDPMQGSDWAGARGRQWLTQLAQMESMLGELDTPLINALALAENLRIAEIGCGGGATAIRLAAECSGTLQVHGVDISEDLVRAAQQRAGRHSNLEFRCIDAGSAPAPEQGYDRLCSRFGIMFFAHPERAFENLFQWIKPDGRFAFAVWGPLGENPWMYAARDAVLSVIDVPPGDPDAPGPFRYAKVQKLLSLLSDAGFRDAHAIPWTGKLRLGGALSADDAASFALSAFSFAEPLQSLPEEYARAHQSLANSYAQHLEEGFVRMNAAVHIVTGGR